MPNVQQNVQQKSQKILISTGINKDVNGEFKRKVSDIVYQNNCEITENPKEASLIVVLGGDGSIMRASHTAIEHNIPIVGINLGKVGYMAELDPGEINLLDKYFKNEYEIEKRMALKVTIANRVYVALNDAVIHASTTHMAQITLSCDKSFVNTYSCDGIICATPTGSTAYSMSAGGSVVDPKLECICVTPICPQSLSARPLIFSSECELSFAFEKDSRKCVLAVDGGDEIPINKSDTVTVTRCDSYVNMIKLKENRFFNVLRQKMSE